MVKDKKGDQTKLLTNPYQKGFAELKCCRELSSNVQYTFYPLEENRTPF